MGDKKARDMTLKALKKAAGYVQYELSCRVVLKYLPQIRFYLDQSLDYSEHINHVITELREKGDMGSGGNEDDFVSDMEEEPDDE
jgi:ribosome-binding factor A